jgi:hypothetical protein
LFAAGIGRGTFEKMRPEEFAPLRPLKPNIYNNNEYKVRHCAIGESGASAL